MVIKAVSYWQQIDTRSMEQKNTQWRKENLFNK